MKKLLEKFTLVMMCLFISGGVFCSCSDDDNNDAPVGNSSIVGTWTQTNDAGTVIDLIFSSNKSGQIVYNYKTGNSATEFFEYVYTVDTDGDAYLRIVSEDCQLAGSYDVYVTPTMLTLEAYLSSGKVTYQFKKK